MTKVLKYVGWVAEPGGRGTFSPLTTCLATLVLSTLSAVHPNVPAPEDSALKIVLLKARNITVTIFAPEFVASRALEEHFYILRLHRKQRVHHSSGDLWSLKQYYFLYMGGYVIKSQGHTYSVKPPTLVQWIQGDLVERPRLTDEDIDDRSKASWLTKVIALLQISHFCLQLSMRAIQHLPVTTLELLTLGNVLGAIVIYACSWEKPFDIQRRVELADLRDERLQVESPPIRYDGREPFLSASFNADLASGNPKDDSPIAYKYYIPLLILVSFPLFLGWDLHFATKIKIWMWRIGCILNLVLPLISLTTLHFKCMESLGGMIALAYCVVRFYMMIEALGGLRHVPRGVYKTVNWTNYLPSIG